MQRRQPLALHTVTRCDLGTAPLCCESAAVLGTMGRVFYVSAGSVSVWTQGRDAALSAVFRLPLDSSAPSGIKTVGMPTDPMCFLEAATGHQKVLLRETGPGEGMAGNARSAGRPGRCATPRSVLRWRWTRPTPTSASNPWANTCCWWATTAATCTSAPCALHAVRRASPAMTRLFYRPTGAGEALLGLPIAAVQDMQPGQRAAPAAAVVWLRQRGLMGYAIVDGGRTRGWRGEQIDERRRVSVAPGPPPGLPRRATPFD